MSAVKAAKSGPPVRDEEGYYATPLGRFMSVTTIIGLGVPKPALFHWAAFEAAQCAVDNIPDLVKLRGADQRKDMRNWIQKAAERKRDVAADLGSLIHDILECRIIGQPTPELTEEQVPFIEAFDRFLDHWQPEYEAAELTVANPEFGYAGKLDFILRCRGLADALGTDPAEPIMGDYKTGKNVYPEVGLQLAAYRRATVGWTADGTQITPPPTAGGVVVHIRPKSMPNGTIRGYNIRTVDTSDAQFEAFIAARVTAFHQRKGGPASTTLGSPLAVPKLTKVA